jgi:hypothetical protein
MVRPMLANTIAALAAATGKSARKNQGGGGPCTGMLLNGWNGTG